MILFIIYILGIPESTLRDWLMSEAELKHRNDVWQTVKSTSIKRKRRSYNTRCSVSTKLEAIARVKQNESRASVCRSIGKVFYIWS